MTPERDLLEKILEAVAYLIVLREIQEDPGSAARRAICAFRTRMGENARAGRRLYE